MRVVVLLGILAASICVARVAIFHSRTPYLFGQGHFYKELGLALASGLGFAEPHGAWSPHPTILRAPFWPLVLSVPLRICPQCDPVAVTRFAEVLMHAATALGVGVLVWMLSGSRRRTLLAVLVTALLPEAQPLMLGGYCEPCAAAILIIGTLLVCRGGRFFFGGVMVLSLLPLVRPNFLLLWAGVMALIWWLQFRDQARVVFGSKRRLIAAGLLFYIPSGVWMTRNYLVSGAFPVLAGTASTTFYGNYNSYSGTIGPGFGRWIDPNQIPGQEQIASLAARMSEVETLRYYDSKGKEFIAHHWRIVPLMMAAHVVLSALPSPSDGAHKYSFWLLRLVLYAATLVAIRQKLIRLDSWFGVLVASIVLMTAITVVLYSGEGRYLYPQTILLVALVCSARYRLGLPQESGQVTDWLRFQKWGFREVNDGERTA
jgi:hypothetical protein